MFNNFILTVVSDDKPGIVDAIAKVVSQCEGNWLESRLVKLGGKFAGVVHVTLPKDNEDPLKQALTNLKQQGISVTLEQHSQEGEASAETTSAKFHAVGPDRPGIVKEITQALLQHNINLAEIETSLSSMPYSGEPLFEAEGYLQVPEGADLSKLQDAMADIADALGLDIVVSSAADS